jgi:hypothetical protein
MLEFLGNTWKERLLFLPKILFFIYIFPALIIQMLLVTIGVYNVKEQSKGDRTVLALVGIFISTTFYISIAAADRVLM